MQRMLVIGSSGSGKTTVSLRLAEILGLPVVHLDSLYWKPGWIESGQTDFDLRLRDALRRDAWIMDGNYSRTLARRLEACDTVIFLDLPRLTCVWRVLKRALKHRGKNRPDLPEGCPEKIDLEFLQWVWNYPTRTRPKVLSLLRVHEATKAVIHLQTQRDVERFVASWSGRARDSRNMSV